MEVGDQILHIKRIEDLKKNNLLRGPQLDLSWNSNLILFWTPNWAPIRVYLLRYIYTNTCRKKEGSSLGEHIDIHCRLLREKRERRILPTAELKIHTLKAGNWALGGQFNILIRTETKAGWRRQLPWNSIHNIRARNNSLGEKKKKGQPILYIIYTHFGATSCWTILYISHAIWGWNRAEYTYAQERQPGNWLLNFIIQSTRRQQLSEEQTGRNWNSRTLRQNIYIYIYMKRKETAGSLTQKLIKFRRIFWWCRSTFIYLILASCLANSFSHIGWWQNCLIFNFNSRPMFLC